MKATLPNIVKSATSLLIEVEKAVDGFPRKRRYGLGSDMREGAANLVLLGQEASRAAKEPKRQVSLLRELDRAIARLKLQILLAYKLQCYSLQRCEMLSVLAGSCGRQCGGWLASHQHPNGQNSAAQGQRERASKLSTADASFVEAYQ
jgi:hypothetical protein